MTDLFRAAEMLRPKVHAVKGWGEGVLQRTRPMEPSEDPYFLPSPIHLFQDHYKTG